MNKWIEDNYNELLRYASAFTPHPVDLVNHTYLKAINAGFKHNSNEQTEYYFKRSIKINGTCGDFARQYKIYDSASVDEFGNDYNDFLKIENRERMDEVLRHLTEFDRKLFEIYLTNENMLELSRASGISHNTIYDSIKRIKTILKDKLK